MVTGDSLLLLFCGVTLMAGTLPHGVSRSDSTRADSENKGLDRQLSDLSDCPDHVHRLEGQPGPQMGELLVFPSLWVGIVVPAVIGCRVSIIVWTIPVTPY